MLPYYIPIVSPDNIKIFSRISSYFRYAIIPMYLIDKDGIRDLKNYIDSTSIRWILSSIMPDEYLLKRDSYDELLEILDRLGIDIVIAWDTPTYLEDPPELRRERLEHAIEIVKQISDMGYEVIPLVKGAQISEIDEYTNTLLRLDFHILSFHVTQYLVSNVSPLPYLENELYEKPSDYMYRLIKEILSHDEVNELMIIGGSGYNLYRGFLEIDRRIRIAGYSWYLDALGYNLYTMQGKKGIHRRQYICNCPVCYGKNPIELRKQENIALHNLYYIRQTSSGDEYPYETEIYDIILSRNDDLLISGPLHVGDKYSLWREMLDRVREYRPRYLVLAGDIFYNEVSEDIVIEWGRFLKQLNDLYRKYRVIPYPMKGVMEERPYPLTRRHDFLSINTLDPLTMWSDNTRLDNILLKVSRLLSGVRRWISIIKLDGEMKIEVYYERPVDEYTVDEVHTYLSNRKIGRDIWIISTILAEPTIDHTLKVATPGAWHKNPYYYRRKEPGFIYISGDGELEILY